MASTKTGEQQQSKLPLIIVVIGPSNNEKSEISFKIAEFLQCPLIDQEDIIQNLQIFLPNFSYDSTFSTELPFKIVTQISKTQLQLKLQVVISTPLSQHSHFDQLLEVANSKDACLVIVECTSQSHRSHDYDIRNVPKLSIDTKKPFLLDDFVPAILKVAESHKKMNKGKSKAEVKRITAQRCFIEAHAHEFSFTQEPKKGSEKLICSSCEKSISGPTYQCVICDDFILHKSCAESTQKLKTVYQHELFYKESHPSAYNFPQEYKCKLCDYYSSECNDCLLQSHIKCGILPTTCSYEEHTHHFNFVIMPSWFDYEYKCIGCEKYGKFVSYKCYCCCLDLHTSCALKFPRYKALGPWGDTTEREWDDGIFSGVKQLKLCRNLFRYSIDGIQIEYDKNGTSVWSDIHGTMHPEIEEEEVRVDYPNEYLSSIQGYYDHYSGIFVSLTFKGNKSNKTPYGQGPPYGRDLRNYEFFSSPDETGSKIVGFYGTINAYGDLSAIGVYVEPAHQ